MAEELSFDVAPGEPSRLRLEYIRDECSFFAHSTFEGRGVCICINEVQLFFDDEGRVRSVDGYCPYHGWQETELAPPDYSDAALILKRPHPKGVPSGMGIGLNDHDTRWPVYANPQGWVCLGDPAERGDRAIQFATGCLAVLRGDELVACWLLPTMRDACES